MRKVIINFFIVLVFILGSQTVRAQANSSNGSFSRTKFRQEFSGQNATRFGVGNGTGAGGGNGSTGGGVDNGNSNAGGQGNGGGATVPIGSGLWILIIGSSIFLGKKIYLDVTIEKS